MKKSKLLSAIAAMSTLVAPIAVLSGCSKGGDTPPEPTPVRTDRVSIDEKQKAQYVDSGIVEATYAFKYDGTLGTEIQVAVCAYEKLVQEVKVVTSTVKVEESIFNVKVRFTYLPLTTTEQKFSLKFTYTDGDKPAEQVIDGLSIKYFNRISPEASYALVSDNQATFTFTFLYGTPGMKIQYYQIKELSAGDVEVEDGSATLDENNSFTVTANIGSSNAGEVTLKSLVLEFDYTHPDTKQPITEYTGVLTIIEGEIEERTIFAPQGEEYRKITGETITYGSEKWALKSTFIGFTTNIPQDELAKCTVEMTAESNGESLGACQASIISETAGSFDVVGYWSRFQAPEGDYVVSLTIRDENNIELYKSNTLAPNDFSITTVPEIVAPIESERKVTPTGSYGDYKVTYKNFGVFRLDKEFVIQVPCNFYFNAIIPPTTKLVYDTAGFEINQAIAEPYNYALVFTFVSEYLNKTTFNLSIMNKAKTETYMSSTEFMFYGIY